MCEPEEFLDELAANEALLARVRDAVNELIQDDPDVSDEELGWAAVDLATNIIRIPDPKIAQQFTHTLTPKTKTKTINRIP